MTEDKTSKLKNTLGSESYFATLELAIPRAININYLLFLQLEEKISNSFKIF
jgi:hypothetical protein